MRAKRLLAAGIWAGLICHDYAWAQAKARAVWTGAGATALGAPFLDGKMLTAFDPGTGDLAVWEIETKRLRSVTHHTPTQTRQYAYFSVPSRDGRSVAYAWHNDQGFYDLRVADVASREVRVLFRNEEAGFVQPSAWTPDGARILTLLFRKDNISQIAMVDSKTGAVQVLKSLNWVYPKKMDLSPDGRWVVYDSFPKDTPGPRDLYVLAADGSAHERLTEHAAEDLLPVWSPDGKYVLFASDRAGTMGAWRLAMEGAKAVGEAELVQGDLGGFLPMGVTSAGDLYFGMRTGGTDVVVADESGAIKTIRTRTPGRNLAPAWSVDGKQLAYLSLRGTENFGLGSRVVVIHDLATGAERDLPSRLAHVEWVRWSQEGDWLLAAGSDGKGRAGLFRLRTRDGLLRAVHNDESAGFRGVAGDWYGDQVVYSASTAIRITDQEGQGIELVAAGARALAMQPGKGRLAYATRSDVRTKGDPVQQWSLANVEWLAWQGDILLAASDGQVWKLDGNKPVEKAAWKDFAGGPFSLHPSGRQRAYTAGRTRQEVWVLENAFARAAR